MKSTLEETLTYRNDAIIYKFMATWDLPFEEALEIFRETLKWMWLCVRAKRDDNEPVDLGITQATRLLDEMWHTFILFTRDYHAFCERYFGFYVHHAPLTKDEYDQQIAECERDPEAFFEQHRQRFRKQCEKAYDVLGEETAVKWYSEYLDRYTDSFLRSIWKWSLSPYDTHVQKRPELATSVRPKIE